MADATNRYRFYETRWDLLPQLSQERFELEQIFQWKNLRLDERNNLLIESFTVARPDLKV